MSVLSALTGSGRTGLAPTAGGAGKEGAGGQDFASMMDNDTHAASATTPKIAPKSQGKTASQSDKRAEPGRPDSRPDRPGSGRSHGAPEGRAASEADETSSAEKPEANTAEHEDGDADTWPPAGLAGIGMAVLPVPDPATPGLAASLTGAGLATNLANAAAEGLAGLPGNQGGPSGAAIAQVGTSALLAQAATSSKTSADGADAPTPLVTLAALAGTVDSKTDDAGTTSAGADPINLLAMATTAPPSRALGSVPFSGSPTPTPNLHGEQFDDALGARMSWLAEQKIGHAQIRINPAELGPVEVRLHLNGDQVNASFLSAQAEVRHALESSLPRLREMLGQHGFQLGQADVGQQRQQAPQGHSSANGRGSPDTDELLPGTVGTPAVVLHQRGLLDAYA